MKCPSCGSWSTVLRTDGHRRRRECANHHRFTTQEVDMDSPSPRVLTPPELATRWQIHPQTLANWRAQGRGPAYFKLGMGKGTRITYREADVLAFEEACMRRPPAAP